MAVKDELYNRMVEEAAAFDAAASASQGEIAATCALPPVVRAIVDRDKLPKMPEVIIEGILLEGHKMLLTGPSKANKTWCLIALAISVATGGYWIGFRCTKRKVLFIDLETDSRTLQRRISTVAYAKDASVAEVSENLFVWPLRGKSCSLHEIVEELFERYKPGDFGMVVIDPAYMVQDGDENNAKDIREFFAELDRLCVRLGVTVVISHHHSKGAQGLKSAIDRGSGSGVFGRAPDAVVDLTKLILEPGTLQMAREVNSLAATSDLTGWRMSFTLREFPPKPPLDVWHVFPLHIPDTTDLLADCKPDYGGQSEQRKMRQEAEANAKVVEIDAVCNRLMGDGDSITREELENALGWTRPTVNRWLDKSRRFMRTQAEGGGKAIVVRMPAEDEEADAEPEGGAKGENLSLFGG